MYCGPCISLPTCVSACACMQSIAVSGHVSSNNSSLLFAFSSPSHCSLGSDSQHLFPVKWKHCSLPAALLPSSAMLQSSARPLSQEGLHFSPNAAAAFLAYFLSFLLIVTYPFLLLSSPLIPHQRTSVIQSFGVSLVTISWQHGPLVQHSDHKFNSCVDRKRHNKLSLSEWKSQPPFFPCVWY